MKGFLKGRWLGIFISLIISSLSFSSFSLAEGENGKKELPPRLITISPEYPGVIVDKGEEVSIDVIVKNGGQKDEDIFLYVTQIPQGWDAWIKTYSYAVSGVHVLSDKTKTLTFKAVPDKAIGPGEYKFKIKAETEDKELSSEATIKIKVKEEKKGKKGKKVKITTSYPVLRGPTDAKFEFSVEVENNTGKDMVFNLTVQGPSNWDINFKPAYEEKYISSLRVKDGRTESMAVEVKPYILAKPGRYPIKIKVSGEKAEDQAELIVILTGTYKLDVGTVNGLLSLNARQGKTANISFYVKNTGSARQDNIRFLSMKPENWKVEFKPERIDSLNPGEMKQVELFITPYEQALVGDYSVGVSIEGEKVTKGLEFRVSVRASTVWGWIGIGIIVCVVVALVILFIRLGRR